MAPTTAHAGAWTLDPGHFYTTVTYTYFFAENAVDDSGVQKELQVVKTMPRLSQVPARFVDHTVSLYGELGLWPRRLNLVFYVPLQKFLTTEARDGSISYSDTGVGDSNIGLKYKLYDCYFTLSVMLDLGIPSGDALKKNIPTGDNEWSIEPRLLIGKAFQRVPIFLNLEVGYRKRNTGQIVERGFTNLVKNVRYSDDIPLLFQAGYNLRFKKKWQTGLLFLVNLNGIFSVRNGDMSVNDPVSGVAATANNLSFLAIGFGLSWNIIKGLLLNFDSRIFLWGQNTGQGYSVSSGLGYTW